jgi:hypothetical protein
MDEGFVEIVVQRRGRGRRSPRRLITCTLPSGIRVAVGDRVAPTLVRAVLLAVCAARVPC